MAEKFNYAAKLKQLEEIVEWFEGEDIDLDQAIAKFESGVKLAAELKEYLEGVQNQVEVIKQRFDKKLKDTNA